MKGAEISLCGRLQAGLDVESFGSTYEVYNRPFLAEGRYEHNWTKKRTILKFKFYGASKILVNHQRQQRLGPVPKHLNWLFTTET